MLENCFNNKDLIMSISSIQNRLISTLHLNRIPKALNERQRKIALVVYAIFHALTSLFSVYRYFLPKHPGRMSVKDESHSIDIPSYFESPQKEAWQGIFLDQLHIPYMQNLEQSVGSSNDHRDSVKKTSSKEDVSAVKTTSNALPAHAYTQHEEIKAQSSFSSVLQQKDSTSEQISFSPPPAIPSSLMNSSILPPPLSNQNKAKARQEELERKWNEDEKQRLETEFKARTHPDIFHLFETPSQEKRKEIEEQIALLGKDIEMLQETLQNNKELTNRTQLTTLLFEKREQVEKLKLALQGPKKPVKANDKEFPKILEKYTTEELKILIGMIFKGKRPQESDRFYYLYSPAVREKREYKYPEELRKNSSGNAKVKADILETDAHNRARERDIQINQETRQLLDEIFDNWQVISNTSTGQAFLKNEQDWNKYLTNTNNNNAPFIDLLLRRIKYAKRKQEIEERQFDTAENREKALKTLRSFADYTEEPLYVARPYQAKKTSDRTAVITQKENDRKIDPSMLSQMKGQLRSVKNQTPSPLESPEENKEMTQKSFSIHGKEERVLESKNEVNEQELSPYAESAEPRQSIEESLLGGQQASTTAKEQQTPPKATQDPFSASPSKNRKKEEDKQIKGADDQSTNSRERLFEAIKQPHKLKNNSAKIDSEADALLKKIEEGKLTPDSDPIQEAIAQGKLTKKRVETSHKIYKGKNKEINITAAISEAMNKRRIHLKDAEEDADGSPTSEDNGDWD
jgi:hypothetical protein